MMQEKPMKAVKLEAAYKLSVYLTYVMVVVVVFTHPFPWDGSAA